MFSLTGELDMDQGNEKEKQTRTGILEAALREFSARGYSGARVQTIAERADVNKAMLYYYFQNKENLYCSVLRHIGSKWFPRVFPILLESSDLERRVRRFVSTYFDFFSTHPEVGRLILREMSGGGEYLNKVIREWFKEMPVRPYELVTGMLRHEMAKGAVRETEPTQTLLSVIGMCVIYFAGRPVIQTILDIRPEDEMEFLEERKESIVDLILYGLKADRCGEGG